MDLGVSTAASLQGSRREREENGGRQCVAEGRTWEGMCNLFEDNCKKEFEEARKGGH